MVVTTVHSKYRSLYKQVYDHLRLHPDRELRKKMLHEWRFSSSKERQKVVYGMLRNGILEWPQ